MPGKPHPPVIIGFIPIIMGLAIMGLKPGIIPPYMDPPCCIWSSCCRWNSSSLRWRSSAARFSRSRSVSAAPRPPSRLRSRSCAVTAPSKPVCGGGGLFGTLMRDAPVSRASSSCLFADRSCLSWIPAERRPCGVNAFVMVVAGASIWMNVSRPLFGWSTERSGSRTWLHICR